MTRKYNEIDSLLQLLSDIKTDWDCDDLVTQGQLEVNRIVLWDPMDMHIHLRDWIDPWYMMHLVAPLSSKTFAWWVVMPNLTPNIDSVEAVLSYKNRVRLVTERDNFTPFMTLYFKSDYTREELARAKSHIIWIKMYPKWWTTNSEWWVNWVDIESYRSTLAIMQDLEIPLLVHGERVDGGDKMDILDKERQFVSVYEAIAREFPRLKIIMEHVSTKEVLALVDQYENLYATVTLHHLLTIHNHVLEWWPKADLACMPIQKLWDDRKALLKAVLSWNPKIMFGSDSAPHPTWNKYNAVSCCWAFTAPIALQALVEIFESFWQLDKLQWFIRDNALKIYAEQLWNIDFRWWKYVTLERKWFVIPKTYWEWVNTVVPFLAWRNLAWDVTSVENK